MYSLLLVIIYIAFTSLGLPDSLLCSGWPVMHEAFEVPISYMGIVTMIISGCTIFSSLVSDKLTRKLTTPMVTVTSVFLTAVALFGFSFSTKFWMLIVLAIPYGLGAGAIDAALNNYVALHYSSKHMSWLHCFWGVGLLDTLKIKGVSFLLLGFLAYCAAEATAMGGRVHTLSSQRNHRGKSCCICFIGFYRSYCGAFFRWVLNG